MTANGDSSCMRKLLATVVVLLALGAGTAAAGVVPPFPRIPGTWSHAELNVTIGGVPHTLILDRGRIRQVSSTELKLRERDGSIFVIRLKVSTIVRINGFTATIYDLRRGMRAETMRIDGGAAVRVRATTVL
jgi:hypothetical protein